jgi:hypothetical protein
MEATTIVVEQNETFDGLLAKIQQSHAQNITLALPPYSPPALQTLDNFTSLRKFVREQNIYLKFSGENNHAKGLAKLLGFEIEGKIKHAFSLKGTNKLYFYTINGSSLRIFQV